MSFYWGLDFPLPSTWYVPGYSTSTISAVCMQGRQIGMTKCMNCDSNVDAVEHETYQHHIPQDPEFPDSTKKMELAHSALGTPRHNDHVCFYITGVLCMYVQILVQV